jgi:peptidoglycan/xylan/chitin deacetylase (PgdA/CDA1 family)
MRANDTAESMLRRLTSKKEWDRIRRDGPITPGRVARYGLRAVRQLAWAPLNPFLGTVTSVQTQVPVASLTFDDGPHPEFTPRLLDILRRHKASGTFFMLGQSAQKHPELVRRIAEAGHAIGNHTWDHPSFPLISERERHRQLQACADAITPYGLRLFRPPYGEQNLQSRLTAARLRYQVIMFSLDVGDFCEPDGDRLTRLLIQHTQPGSIIVLHDSVAWHPSPCRAPKSDGQPQVDRQPMLTAVERLLESMRGTFRFVTVPELFQCGRPRRENWIRVTPSG